ncbi:3-ketoacyl-(acyl-carrier-protein) reductase (plasmid) [Antarctobacter heliothermus]|uniref:3-ketoacyl-(Acyl-carrier-protein) reductase n=1 Tax=Antarctobacter heliothermus TaxID=74033 RepID=A0A222EBW6_9RHOB|nr:hypothetical protein [Antarctobacter heliothermus]ASP23558.1 3-ketoacyl-(acyl-carrier-protein) reductase [Antarctobacter heliothermus]
MTDLRNVVLAGDDGDLVRSIAERLKAEGCAVSTGADRMNDAGCWGIVYVAAEAPEQPVDALDIDDFLNRTDETMTGAASAVRAALAAGNLRRIVLVGNLAARGRSSVTMPAALGGGLTALARSWALEFAAENVTANTILAEEPQEVAESVAEATAFLLSPRSGMISGQVLQVSRDTDAGILPI